MAILPFLIRQFPSPNEDSLQARMIHDRFGAKKYIADHPEKVNTCAKCGLTPLAVATILGNRELVQLLLSKGANPLSLERHDWTSIHFAEILGHENIKSLLVDAAKKVDSAAVTQFKYLREMLNPVFPKPGDRVAYQKRGNKFIPITASEFARRTGAQFYNGVIATPANLLGLWENLPEKKRDGSTLIRKLHYLRMFLEYEKKPTEFYLEGENICLLKNIEAGKVVGFYGGAIDMDLTKSRYHQLAGINGSHFRNLPVMFPDGVPNCIIQTIELNGIPRHLFISTRKIQAGEKLFVDLGPGDPSKFEYHPISDELISFYKNNPPTALFKKLETALNRKKSFQKEIEIEGMIAEIGYLASTPFAILELTLGGHVDIHSIASGLEDALNYTNLNSGWKRNLNQIISGLKFIFDKFLPPQLKFQQTMIKQDLLKLFREHHLQSIMRFFSILQKDRPFFDSSSERIRYFESLKEHAILDDIVDEWMEGTNDVGVLPESAELALLHMEDPRREAIVPDLIQLTRNNYPHKLDELFEILSGLELRSWFENGGRNSDRLVVTLESLLPEGRRRFYEKRVPHFKARYPELSKEIDQIFNIEGLSLPASTDCLPRKPLFWKEEEKE